MSGQRSITTAVHVTAKGGRYHMARDCVALGKYKTPSVVVVSLAKAQRARKGPCRFCCNRS